MCNVTILAGRSKRRRRLIQELTQRLKSNYEQNKPTIMQFAACLGSDPGQGLLLIVVPPYDKPRKFETMKSM